MESIPYDKRSGKIWFNGETVDWADANIHILNHSYNLHTYDISSS